jgi:hypothetical protein
LNERKEIMASYHLCVKTGKRGTAASHAAYIAREGKHGKDEKQHDLIAVEHGNMPTWANNDPEKFWKMSDKYERANGTAYKEFEIALPSELTLEQQLALSHEFAKQEIGKKPYQFAIHGPIAALGNVTQMHGHFMTSDRIPDDFSRPPELHFKRYNQKHPELGGCKKDSGGRDPSVLEDEIRSRRKRWAELQNKHLEMHGHASRVDHRSNRDRGIEKEPEKHLGAAAIKKMTEEEKAQIRDKRQSNSKTN